MSCIVTFKIGDQVISLDLKSGPDTSLTDQEILQALQDNPDKRLELSNAIQNYLYKQGQLRTVRLSDLMKMEGLKGNTDVQFLQGEFPSIQFPQGVNANVLFVNNLEIGGQSIYGRVINSNGDELFIIKDSKGDIEKLANFLTIRKKIEDQSFVFDEGSNYYKNLQQCLKVRNSKKPTVDNVFQMLLDFIYNRKKYDSLYFVDDQRKQQSVYAYLQKINNTILQYSERVIFSDPFVNTINQLRRHLDNNDGFISFDALYNAAQQYHKDILESLNIKTLKEFKDFFNSSEQDGTLSTMFQQQDGEKRYATLLRGLFSTEPEFTWNFVRTTNKGIILRSSPKTIQAKYGIEYDTIHTFDIIDNDFFGYKLYRFTDENGNQKFISSRGFLTEQNQTKIYDSLEELQKYIQTSVSKQDIKKNSLIEFKYREKLDDVWATELDSFNIVSAQSLVPGSVIESIDVPVNENQEFYNSDEANLFKLDRQNYDSFSRIVRKWNISDEIKNNILNDINTPEKIALFLYKVNELLKADRSNEQVISTILEQIQTQQRKYYYIDSKQSYRGKYKYRVIPTNPNQIENYKKDKQVPVTELISAIGQVLNSQFGVSINMLTSSEVKEMFPDIDANTAKAFIRNGQIYINTTIAEVTDPLHEFTHLILGVLKSDPQLIRNYEQLMYIVSNTDEGRRKIQKLREIYDSISEVDLMEEAFVDLFSSHILGQLNPNFERIFTSVDTYMQDATKIIFNNPIQDLNTFYGQSLQTVFRRFNSDVASLLEQKDIDFVGTQQSRKLSNWISKQINEGEIKEECYG